MWGGMTWHFQVGASIVNWIAKLVKYVQIIKLLVRGYKVQDVLSKARLTSQVWDKMKV